MKFFDYCATQYAIINTSMQVDSLTDQFDLRKQAQTKASHELIETQRQWFKFTAKVAFVFNYLLCHFTKKWPKMPVVEKTAPLRPIHAVQNEGTANTVSSMSLSANEQEARN